MDELPLKIDSFEPHDAHRILAPVLPCEVDDLNNKGYADYLWPGIEGTQQVERKTWQLLTERFLKQTAVSPDPPPEPAPAKPTATLPPPAASPASDAYSSWTDTSGCGSGFSHVA